MIDPVILQGLTQAQALIANPDNHLRGRLATNADNQPMSPYLPDACKFDALGAIYHTFRHSYALEEQAIRLLTRFMIPNGDTTISSLNDLLPHDAFMRRWTNALNAIRETQIHVEAA